MADKTTHSKLEGYIRKETKKLLEDFDFKDHENDDDNMTHSHGRLTPTMEDPRIELENEIKNLKRKITHLENELAATGSPVLQKSIDGFKRRLTDREERLTYY